MTSSGASTPVDLLSADASADNSEMSDDGEQDMRAEPCIPFLDTLSLVVFCIEPSHGGSGRLKRQRHVRMIAEESLSPTPRPRSMVIHKDSSPARSPSPGRAFVPQMSAPTGHAGQLQLSDGSDSDVMNSGEFCRPRPLRNQLHLLFVFKPRYHHHGWW